MRTPVAEAARGRRAGLDQRAGDRLAVGFGGHQVVVESALPSVLAGARAMFAAMLEPPRVGAVAPLRVSQTGRRYRTGGPGDHPEEVRSLAETLRLVKYRVTLHLIESRPDLLWLHAGAGAREGRAVLILGAGGAGKSTLVTHLVKRGWLYLTDDVLPLDMAGDQAWPFPQRPSVRRGRGKEIAPKRVDELEKAVVRLSRRAIGQQPVPAGALVFPRFRCDAPAALEPASPARACVALLEHCLNFRRHRDRAIRYAADLIARLPASYLTYSDPEAAVRLIDAAWPPLGPERARGATPSM